MELADQITEIVSYFSDPPDNEANTCDLVIRPLLLAMGYLPRDINRESKDHGGNRPDYTILPNEAQFRFYIEAKAWKTGLEEKHVNQAITYAHLNGDRWVILTNGHIWRLYDDHIRGIPAAKLAIEVNIRNQVEALAFFCALSRESVRNGQLESSMSGILAVRPLKTAIVCQEIVFPDAAPDSDAGIVARYFWHICVHSNKPDRQMDDNWWMFLKTNGQLSCGFEGQKGDKGDKILNGYQIGDTVLAYAAKCGEIKYGAIGWGIVEKSNTYRLLKKGEPDDVLAGDHLHRLDIRWHAVAPRLADAISAEEIKGKFQIEHPHQTRCKVDAANAKLLVDELTKRFGVVLGVAS